MFLTNDLTELLSLRICLSVENGMTACNSSGPIEKFENIIWGTWSHFTGYWPWRGASAKMSTRQYKITGVSVPHAQWSPASFSAWVSERATRFVFLQFRVRVLCSTYFCSPIFLPAVFHHPTSMKGLLAEKTRVTLHIPMDSLLRSH